MRIILISPPCRMPNALPLGLGYIASVLRQEGYTVNILDINGFGYSNEKVAELIRTLNFEIAGIGGLSTTYKYVKWLAALIKKYKPNIPIIAGNMVSTAHPALLLKYTDIDIAVIGEGELTAKELIPVIRDRRNLKEVRGIFFKENGSIIKNAPRERITDLDSLPFPAWDLFPMETYLNNSTATPVSYGLRAINISTIRGCPYDCTFCSRGFGKRVYVRSPLNVVIEIKELKRRYGIGFIGFSDELFLVNEARVLELCDRLVSERLNIKWSVNARANLVNYNLLKKMRKAGCVQVGYGFESGSQSMLDRMKKQATVKQAEEAIKVTKRVGIRISPSFIFGMPGETLDTIRETLDFIKRNQIIAYRFFYANPYPNTELYEIARKMGRLPADEDKYMENLDEQRLTFLVNLTNFSDEELLRLKNWAELIAKNSLNFMIHLQLFIENWQRRYFVMRINIRKFGVIYTVRNMCRKVVNKILVKNPQA